MCPVAPDHAAADDARRRALRHRLLEWLYSEDGAQALGNIDRAMAEAGHNASAAITAAWQDAESAYALHGAGAAPGPRLARAEFGINHVMAYGQSFSSGWQGFPALSLTARPNTLMLGNSVRPASEFQPNWRPVGAPVFRPLVATVQDPHRDTLFSPEQVASFKKGAAALGETVLEGAVTTWQALDSSDHVNPATLLASSCGVGGRTIELLSKGADPELFNRLRDCARLARDAANTAGRSYGIVALLFLQGEHNVFAMLGGSPERARYRALLEQFYRDFVADVAADIAGQPHPPAMFIYQTGGTYATNDLRIAQAQLDVALSLPGCFMVAPTYMLPEKDRHLDGNGYRWLGAQFGKVMHRVLTRGETWMPLHATRAELSGGILSVTFHVPVPPLAWGRPWSQEHGLLDFADKGFSVVDQDGLVPVADVVLVGADRVRILLGRQPRGGTLLRYGDQVHGGRGCLRDSDATPSELRFVADTDEPLAHLHGRPYPLMNWCVAFTLPVTGADEASNLPTGT
jgi:hypothetical protein